MAIARRQQKVASCYEKINFSYETAALVGAVMDELKTREQAGNVAGDSIPLSFTLDDWNSRAVNHRAELNVPLETLGLIGNERCAIERSASASHVSPSSAPRSRDLVTRSSIVFIDLFESLATVCRNAINAIADRSSHYHRAVPRHGECARERASLHRRSRMSTG